MGSRVEEERVGVGTANRTGHERNIKCFVESECLGAFYTLAMDVIERLVRAGKALGQDGVEHPRLN